MPIWVDADACPQVVRTIIIKAALRTGTTTTFIANRPTPLPPSPLLISRQVAAGFDVADNAIVEAAGPGDLVITADIPLAAEAIDKGATVLTFRGESLTAANVRARLNMRDFLETMRSSGIQSGGPAPFDQRDRKAFADALDRWLGNRR